MWVCYASSLHVIPILFWRNKCNMGYLDSRRSKRTIRMTQLIHTKNKKSFSSTTGLHVTMWSLLHMLVTTATPDKRCVSYSWVLTISKGGVNTRQDKTILGPHKYSINMTNWTYIGRSHGDSITWTPCAISWLQKHRIVIYHKYITNIIGPILDDRLEEKILKPWKGALSSHSVCLSVCLSVRPWTGYKSHLLT